MVTRGDKHESSRAKTRSFKRIGVVLELETVQVLWWKKRERLDAVRPPGVMARRRRVGRT